MDILGRDSGVLKKTIGQMLKNIYAFFVVGLVVLSLLVLFYESKRAEEDPHPTELKEEVPLTTVVELEESLNQEIYNRTFQKPRR